MDLGSVTTALVVVTHNSADVLAGLADSLPDGLAGVPAWHLVVVDNASTDGTPEVVRRLLPDAELVPLGRNGGYAAGINAGLRVVPPDEVVVVLNPDLTLDAGCIAALLVTLGDGSVGAAVPRMLTPSGELSPSLRRDPSAMRAWSEALLGGRRASGLGLGELVGDPQAYEIAHDVDWATGAALAISPIARARVGDWDESFFLYSEEVDWFRRLREGGLRVRYEPAAVVRHRGGAYDADPALWRILMANRVREHARRGGSLSRASHRLALLTGEVLRSPGARGAAHRAGARAVLLPDRVPQEAPRRQPTSQDGPGFVWFAAQDWWYHNQAHSDFQLMRHVAAVRPVLVVNSLGLRMPTPGRSTHAGRRVLRKARSVAKVVRRPVPGLPGFHVMTPVLIPAYGDTRAARLNAWLVRQQVRLVARAVGIGDAPHIGVTIPSAWPVVEAMDRSSLVFNRSDLHSAFPEADGAWVAGLEDSLLRHSDRVLYVSHELMKRDWDVVGDRGVFLDHGVDVDHFTPDGDIDPEVAAIPRPRLGFFGGLDDYVVDMDLLRRTAEDNPDASLVLVGDATCSMDELTRLPNVHWLGFRAYSAIPAIGRGFDVGLMPWLDNEWIRFANPIKLKEYLALGLPVVSTDYPEVEAYRDRVQVAGERTTFPELARRAADVVPDRAALRGSVLSSSWAARAGQLIDVADRAAHRDANSAGGA